MLVGKVQSRSIWLTIRCHATSFILLVRINGSQMRFSIEHLIIIFEEESDPFWTMYFDGALNEAGKGVVSLCRQKARET